MENGEDHDKLQSCKNHKYDILLVILTFVLFFVQTIYFIYSLHITIDGMTVPTHPLRASFSKLKEWNLG